MYYKLRLCFLLTVIVLFVGFTSVASRPHESVKEKYENRAEENPWNSWQKAWAKTVQNGMEEMVQETKKMYSKLTAHIKTYHESLAELMKKNTAKLQNLTRTHTALKTLLINTPDEKNETNSSEVTAKKPRVVQMILKSVGISKKPLVEKTTYEDRIAKGITGSLNEAGPVFKTLDSKGCGGIVVADKGIIAYLAPESFKQEDDIRCVWTVRGSRKGMINFKIISFGLSETNNLTTDAVITLTPMNNFSTIIMSKSPEDKYTTEGPVVFVTLISKSKTPVPDFQLSFESEGEDLPELIDKYYVHYHYDLPYGTLSYPKMRKAEKYNPNEIATFVINPKYSDKSRKVTWDFYDIEEDAECQKDSVSFLFNDGDLLYTNRSLNSGYCGNANWKNATKMENISKFPLIAVFTSDDKNEFKGFQFNWK